MHFFYFLTIFFRTLIVDNRYLSGVPQPTMTTTSVGGTWLMNTSYTFDEIRILRSATLGIYASTEPLTLTSSFMGDNTGGIYIFGNQSVVILPSSVSPLLPASVFAFPSGNNFCLVDKF